LPLGLCHRRRMHHLPHTTHSPSYATIQSSSLGAMQNLAIQGENYSYLPCLYMYFYAVNCCKKDKAVLTEWHNHISHYSNAIFRLQKRIIRIIVGLRRRDLCREHFKKLKILPLQSQYILSLLLFMVGNRSYFKENSDIHNINTRTKSNLHQPLATSSTYQKGAYY
jgi:hypothetical protein